MLNLARRLAHRLLKLPPEPPAPFGEEQSLRVFRAAPNFLKYRLVMWVIGNIVGAVFLLGCTLGGLIAAFQAAESWVGGLATVAAVLFFLFGMFQLTFSFITLRLDYENRWYKVTDRSLRIREGIWQVREMTMTFANIQNIEITQGPIQRYLGISDLKVQTAGGGGAAAGNENQQNVLFNMHVGYFRGVDNAEEILALMQERLRKYRSAGLGNREEEHLDAGARNQAAALPASPDVLEAAQAMLAEARALRAAAAETCNGT